MTINRKILILEDNQSLSDLIKKSLEKEKIYVVESSNLREMQDKLALEKPDILVADMVLSDPFGLQILSEIHAEPERYGRPKIIAISGSVINWAHVSILKESRQIDCFFQKPFSIICLIQMIKRILNSEKNKKTCLRRNEKRYPFNYPIDYSSEGLSRTRLTFCGNLSQSGMMLAILEKCPEKTILWVKIPFYRQGKVDSVDLKGEIIWSESPDGKNRERDSFSNQHLVGLRFINLSEDQRVKLNNAILFVNEHSSKLNGYYQEARMA